MWEVPHVSVLAAYAVFHSNRSILCYHRLVASYTISTQMIQLYLSFKISNLDESKIKVESCTMAIKQCMSDNLWKLNDDKTEFLTPTGNRSRTYKFDIKVGDHMIQFSPIALQPWCHLWLSSAHAYAHNCYHYDQQCIICGESPASASF